MVAFIGSLAHRGAGVRPMSHIKLLVIDSRAPRRHILVEALGTVPSARLLGQGADLSDGHVLAEDHMPDVILLSSELAALPEFEMFFAMIRMIGAQCLIYGSQSDFGDLPALCLPLNSQADALSIAQRFAARASPQDVGTFRPDPQAIVVIGASTGGVEALDQIIADYPATCPPTVIVQHIRGAFSYSLVSRLDRIARASVRAAEEGALLRAGTVYVVCGNEHHARLVGRGVPHISLQGDLPVHGHRPSVDVLFTSAAEYGARVTGVILTGMGHDGAAGLMEIRHAGGNTIGQDAQSSRVYGMPRVAAERGAVQYQLPLSDIAAKIRDLTALTLQGERVKA